MNGRGGLFSISMQRIEGTITQIRTTKDDLVRENRFLVANVITASSEKVTVKGSISRRAELGDYIVGNFVSETNPTYGDQMKSTGLIEVHLPRTAKTIMKRCADIANDSQIKLTPSMRDEIVQLAGEESANFWKNFVSHQANIPESSRLRFPEFKNAVKKYVESRSAFLSSSLEVEQYFADLGLAWSSGVIRKLLGYEKDCEDPQRDPIVLEMLRKDPLCIVDLKGIKSRQVIDYLNALRSLKVVDDETVGVGYLMNKCLNAEQSGGACCIPVVETEVAALRSHHIFKRYLREYRGGLYRVETFCNERVIAEFIEDCVTADPLPVFEALLLEEIRQLPADEGRIPNREQCAAVVAMFQNRISTMQGSAGSGKTTSSRLLSRFIKECAPELRSNIVFLAPTGKAVNRIKESQVDIELASSDNTMTMHRFAGLVEAWIKRRTDPNRDDGREVEECIRAPLMIVFDESSMIDNKTLAMVIKAIRNYNYIPHIVLMGDGYQLAPVGPGSPFMEIITSGVVHNTTLRTVHRQGAGSSLLAAITEIRDATDISVSEPDAFQICKVNGDTRIRAIKRWVDEHKAGATAIIVPTGDVVAELTPIIRDHVNPASEESNLYVKGELLTDYRKDDKIMQTKNNYERTVFNGDVGVIVGIVEDKNGDGPVYKLHVRFNGRQNDFYYRLSEAREELQLAYVINTHKAQGSEYLDTLIIMDRYIPNFINRNHIYTAGSRGKRSVKILIREKGVMALWKTVPSKRATNLAAQILDRVEVECGTICQERSAPLIVECGNC